jgi:hypothetical protein
MHVVWEFEIRLSGDAAVELENQSIFRDTLLQAIEDVIASMEGVELEGASWGLKSEGN